MACIIRAISHHHNCINVFLTGGKLDLRNKNTISVDQKMAEITAKHTRYSSMEIALTGESLGWTADGVRLPAMRRCSESLRHCLQNPKGVRRLSEGCCATKQVCSMPTCGSAKLEQAMGSADKGRLDQYLTSVREAEIRTRRADAWLDTPLPTISEDDRKRTNRDVAQTMAGDIFAPFMT